MKRTYQRLGAAHEMLSFSVLCNATQYNGDKIYEIENIAVRRIAARIFAGWRGYQTGLARQLGFALRAYAEAWRTWRALRRCDADLLHVVGESASTATAIIWAARTGKPMIIELVTSGATPWQNLPGLSRFLRHDLNARTVVIAISKAIADDLPPNRLEGRIWVRPNPVDGQRFKPAFDERAALRAKHTPFAPNDRVLCSVAKLTPQKNPAFLIKVLAQLPPRYKLVIAGPQVAEGPEQTRDAAYVMDIRRHAEELGLSNRLLLVSDFVDAAAFIHLADVFVMPARREGLGTPALEAMACGVPVVANREEECFREWVIDGEGGWTCDLDPEAWAEAVVRACDLDEAHMVNVAAKITKTAGAEEIDMIYWRLLTNLNDGNVVSLKNILDSGRGPASP